MPVPRKVGFIQPCRPPVRYPFSPFTSHIISYYIYSPVQLDIAKDVSPSHFCPGWSCLVFGSAFFSQRGPPLFHFITRSLHPSRTLDIDFAGQMGFRDLIDPISELGAHRIRQKQLETQRFSSMELERRGRGCHGRVFWDWRGDGQSAQQKGSQSCDPGCHGSA